MIVNTPPMCDHAGGFRRRVEVDGNDTVTLVLPDRNVLSQVLTIREVAPGHVALELVVRDGDLSDDEVAALESGR